MTGVRVTGGTLRGRRIHIPKEIEIRPTSERARQAFFNIVQDQLQGARFLDLFAGSGIFSFEAISRGAVFSLAVERSRRAAESIRKTAAEWNVALEVRSTDVLQTVRGLSLAEPFDLVYADPPYAFEHYEDLIAQVDATVPLAPGAVVAFEHQAKKDPPGATLALRRLERRRVAQYGNVAISIFDLLAQPTNADGVE